MVYDIIVDNLHATEEMKIETAEFLLDLPRPYDVYFYSLNYFPARRSPPSWRTACWTERGRGRANKSWYQFRVSMDWPRSDEDRFYLALFSLASKSFVPKSLIRSSSMSGSTGSRMSSRCTCWPRQRTWQRWLMSRPGTSRTASSPGSRLSVW